MSSIITKTLSHSPKIHFTLSVHWIEAAVICLKFLKIQFPVWIDWSKPKLDSCHLTSVIAPCPISRQCLMLTDIWHHSCCCSPSDTLCVRVIVFQCFDRGVKGVLVHINIHVLNYTSPGAVYLHPRCHSRGVSVWRNSHPSLRVQSCFLWADPHRLADQLVTSERWVPGKPKYN